MDAAYRDRLKALINSELIRSGNSQAELARQMGVSPQAVSGWLSDKTNELSPGSVASLAELLAKDRGSLLHYLHTGEWLPEQQSELEVLANRVAALEAKLLATSQPPPAPQVTSRTVLKMSLLGKTIQDAIAATDRDWRDEAVLYELHGFFKRPESQGGLGYSQGPMFTAGRLQRIVWGLVYPSHDEAPEIATLMECVTGDMKWTHEYVMDLINGYANQGYTISEQRLAPA